MPNRLLIVEDEHIAGAHLGSLLTRLGYEVAQVSNASEAIKATELNSPDLVLMHDCIGRPANATDTAGILRDRFDIPVVLVTPPCKESELKAAVDSALFAHRSDRQFRDHSQHLAAVLNAVSHAIISIDSEERVVVLNAAASDLTGWTEAEAAKDSIRNVFRLADPVTGREVDLALTDVLDKHQTKVFQDKLLIAKNGERMAIAGAVTALRGTKGRCGAVVTFEPAPVVVETPVVIAPGDTARNLDAVEFGRFHVIAASAELKKVLEFALRVARSKASVVLLEGESGTGKDLIAQFIHHSSSRAAHPFVAVSCTAIPDTLLESELFGHEAGAFSDARTQKRGLFEMANRGTLFLDEIGDVSRTIQSKLLRVLETQCFRRLGGVHDIEVDVRVISATNRFLAAAVQADDFRLDLFHRLGVIQITIPPLRQRPEDILPLARHFVREFALKYKGRVQGISSGAAYTLESYQWPGNVRELRNVIERAVLIETREAIQKESIRFLQVESPPKISVKAEPVPEDLTLSVVERKLIVEALAKTGGNKTKAAVLLGISRDVLRYRMKKLAATSGT